MSRILHAPIALTRRIALLFRAGYANRWAKYKPVRVATRRRLTDADRAAAGYGLEYSGSITPSMAASGGYAYNPPAGGAYPMRLLDLDGYYAEATAPCLKASNFTVHNIAGMADTFELHMAAGHEEGEGEGMRGNLTVSDFPELAGRYMAVMWRSGTQWTGITAAATLAEGGNRVSIPSSNILPTGTVDAYVVASQHGTGGQVETMPAGTGRWGTFYPLPFDKPEHGSIKLFVWPRLTVRFRVSVLADSQGVPATITYHIDTVGTADPFYCDRSPMKLSLLEMTFTSGGVTRTLAPGVETALENDTILDGRIFRKSSPRLLSCENPYISRIAIEDASQHYDIAAFQAQDPDDRSRWITGTLDAAASTATRKVYKFTIQ